MSFLKYTISIMRCDFKSRSCFSGVLGYSGLSVVVELGLDDAMLPSFLLVMFLHLCFVIYLSLVVAGLAISECGLSVLPGDPFSLCTSVCKYSCETHSIVVVFRYTALWPRSTMGVGGT